MMRMLPDLRAWLWLVLRNPMPFLAMGLASAIGGFLYSYGPLHEAERWKIQHLEERLDARNAELRQLRKQLESAAADSGGADLEGELRSLESELEEARREAGKARKDSANAKEEIKKLTRARKRWKKRHAEVEKKLESATGELAEAKSAATASTPPIAATAAPAMPASDAGAGAEVLTGALLLRAGTGWQSPDGRMRVEVQEVRDDVAALTGSWQGEAEGTPEFLAVEGALSERFDDATYRVTVTRIVPHTSVTIRAVKEPTPPPPAKPAQ